MISVLTASQVTVILGIINLASGLLILFSCRCVPTLSFAKGLMKQTWYQKFYRFHCYIWWVFWGSVIVHAVFAIIYFGWPF